MDILDLRQMAAYKMYNTVSHCVLRPLKKRKDKFIDNDVCAIIDNKIKLNSVSLVVHNSYVERP
uniref:Uncharacterized protein n=1 Tax=viral metagenome TaxID=1070528 RepID=A0A6M3LQ62_9ZZZZ